MKRHPLFFVLMLGGLVLLGASGCAGGNPLISDAESALEDQNYEQALASVNQAIQQDSAGAQAYLLKGRILMAQAGTVQDPQRHTQLVDEAAVAWEQAVSMNTELRSDVQNRRLFAYSQEFTMGADAFNQARSASGDSLNILYNQAAAYFGAAAQLQPDSARASRFQAYAYVNAGQPEEAVQPLQNLVDLGAADTTDYALLGQLYLQNNQGEQAVAVLEQGIEQYPGSQDIQSLLLNAYMRSGRTEEAMERYASLVEQEPNNKIYRYNYGSMLLEAEQYDAAIEQLKAAIQLDPNYANAQYNLGAAYVNKAVEVNNRIAALNDSLSSNESQLSQAEASEIEAQIQELAQQRKSLFAQAIPSLEKARQLAQSGDTSVQAAEICRALFTAYVQTGQQDKAETVQGCAGMG